MMFLSPSPLHTTFRQGRGTRGSHRERNAVLVLVGVCSCAGLLAAWRSEQVSSPAFVGIAAEEPAGAEDPCNGVGAAAFKEGFQAPLTAWHTELTANKPVRNFGKQADDAHTKTLARFDALEKKAGLSCKGEREKLDAAMTHVIIQLYQVQVARAEKAALLVLRDGMMKSPEQIPALLQTYLTSVEKTIVPFEPKFLKGLGEKQMDQVKLRLSEILKELERRLTEAEAQAKA